MALAVVMSSTVFRHQEQEKGQSKDSFQNFLNSFIHLFTYSQSFIHFFHSTNFSSNAVLLSYCCCNKLPQTQWLKTTQIYSFSSGGQNFKVSFAGLKSRCQNGRLLLEVWMGESVSLPFSSSSGHLCIPRLGASSSIFKPHPFNLCLLHLIMFSSGSDSSCLPLIRTVVIIPDPAR